jgi:AmmeMemoRadiSam system protein B
MGMAVRHAAVAGRFYPRDAGTLLADVRSYLTPPPAATISALGCVAPHAGYIYSGQVAGTVFAKLDLPRRCVVLGPNHTGRGKPLSIMSHGTWETPLGQAPIDSDLAASFKGQFPPLSEDMEAHRSEHAIEVELPFLQALRPDFRFVPIALGTAQFAVLEALGEAVGEVVRAQSEPVLLIASSDMNHYENDSITRVKDQKAIDRVLALDARGLFDVVMNEEISMCGFGPAVVMLTAAKRLGAASAELVGYATSGDVSGDREMVVGYAGIVVR